jgi:cytoskeletal protein RodZ
MFALLAFALFPVAAGADSSGAQYSDAPPTATGKEIVKETPAESSQSHNGGVSNPSNTSNSQESHSSDSESSPGSTASKSDTPPPSSPSTNQNNDNAGQQSTQGQGPQAKTTGAHPQSQLPAAKSETAQDDGGGSSPLLPILIAIAVLAAISIGAVMLRQRRRRGVPVKSASPKAS